MIKSSLLLTEYNQTKFYIEYIIKPNDELEYVFIVFESLIHFQIKLKDTKLQKKLQVNFTNILFERLYNKSTSANLKSLTFNFEDVKDTIVSPQHINKIELEVNKLVNEYKNALSEINNLLV